MCPESTGRDLCGPCSPCCHPSLADLLLMFLVPLCPTQALNEEKVAYERSPSKNIYLNVAVNTLKKLRGLVPNTVPNLSSEWQLCREGPAQTWGLMGCTAGTVPSTPHGGCHLRFPLPLPPSLPRRAFANGARGLFTGSA